MENRLTFEELAGIKARWQKAQSFNIPLTLADQSDAPDVISRLIAEVERLQAQITVMYCTICKVTKPDVTDEFDIAAANKLAKDTGFDDGLIQSARTWIREKADLRQRAEVAEKALAECQKNLDYKWQDANEAWKTVAEFRVSLAEKDAEIERLKGLMAQKPIALDLSIYAKNDALRKENERLQAEAAAYRDAIEKYLNDDESWDCTGLSDALEAYDKAGEVE